MMPTQKLNQKKAFSFIILLGLVSLFADITYEGARSIIGPYLSVLGASGAAVGIISGFGELIGYSVRSITGYLSDKSRKYWLYTFIGYIINSLSIPLLALTNTWPIASFLIIAERFGKAVRSPSRDAMLSYATKEVGRGYGFGIHGALDQLGGVIGPLIIAAVLFYHGSYKTGFAILFIPAIIALILLFTAKKKFPHPEQLEPSTTAIRTKGFSKIFWLFLSGNALIAAGFVDFPLISYHFQKIKDIEAVSIPLMYTGAMISMSISSLIFGRLYDRKGLNVLIFIMAISAFFVLLVFIDGIYSSLAGCLLWGIGLGSQKTIVRAVIANLVEPHKRATAYGLANLSFGIAWFFGSAIMGMLYDLSLNILIVFSFSMQMAALPFFILVKERMPNK